MGLIQDCRAERSGGATPDPLKKVATGRLRLSHGDRSGPRDSSLEPCRLSLRDAIQGPGKRRAIQGQNRDDHDRSRRHTHSYIYAGGHRRLGKGGAPARAGI